MNNKKVTYSTEQLSIFAWFALQAMTEFKNLIIVARAGVGKTFTMICAMLQYATESNILYGVFNKRNQLEAEAKIGSNKRITVKTWHAVGYAIIVKVWGRIKANFYAEWNRAEQVCPELKERKYLIALVASLVSKAKNKFIGVPGDNELIKLALSNGIEANDKDEAAGWTVEKLANIASKVMQLSLQRSYEISFDDMVWLPVSLGIVRPEYDLVVGDEAQDLNLLQLTMVQQIVKPTGRVCLVGDDKQAIYGFRGALPNGMGIMKERLQAGVLTLTQTFRCPKKVVAMAQSLVPDYLAHESNPEGTVEHVTHDKLAELARVGDAILSRVNAPLMRVCLTLLKRGTTARIEGKDIAKQLQNIIKDIGGNDISAFLTDLEAWRVTALGKAVGRKADQKAELIQDQFETLEALAEASNSVKDMSNRLYSLFADVDDNPRPSVVCSSVHKAKGLEWPRVFILNETFNRQHKNATVESMEEEKNIHYVAITRTMESLFVVNAGKQP